MNRLLRRKLARQRKGQHIQINPEDNAPVDHSKDQFCHRHELRLDNIDDPTPRDKKLQESVRLVPFKYYDKTGKAEIGRKCPRCHFTINVKQELINTSNEGMIILPKQPWLGDETFKIQHKRDRDLHNIVDND